jgi:hypothetical protein
MYQDDNGIFDTPEPHHSHARNFASTFLWTMAGVALGESMANTRFGRWFNTSRLVGWIFRLIGLFILYLIGDFIYEVIKVW